MCSEEEANNDSAVADVKTKQVMSASRLEAPTPCNSSCSKGNKKARLGTSVNKLALG